MDLYAQYELFEAVRERGIKTHKAREKATGREVLVHIAEPGSTTISDTIAKLPPEKRAQILAEGEHSGKAFVVTDRSTGRFAEWTAPIDHLAQTGQWNVTRIGIKAIPEDAPKAGAAGEFTRMFQAPVGEGEPTVAMEPPAPPPSTSEAGEFTRMFSSPPPATTEKQKQTPPPPPPPPEGFVLTKVVDPVTPIPTVEVPAKPPGEFTRMFQSPAPSGRAPEAPPPAPIPQAPAPAPSGPGEFTRMFQSPAASGSPPEAQSPAPKPQAPAPPPSGPGEFTRMFQSPTPAGPAPRTAPPPSSEPGEFTRMFNAPPPSNPAMGRPPQPPPPGQYTEMVHGRPGAGGSTGGGEFTRIFGKGASPAPETPKPQTPPPPQQGAGEFTRMFEAPPAPQRPQPPAAPTPVQAPAFQTPQFQAPSYQPPSVQPPQFQAPQFQPPSVQAPVAPQLPAATPRATNYLPLVLILAGLLVVAVLMLIYFAMRK